MIYGCNQKCLPFEPSPSPLEIPHPSISHPKNPTLVKYTLIRSFKYTCLFKTWEIYTCFFHLSPSQLLDAQIFAAPELAPLNLHSPQMRRILNKQLNSLGVYPKIVHNIHIYKAFAAPEQRNHSNTSVPYDGELCQIINCANHFKIYKRIAPIIYDGVV